MRPLMRPPGLVLELQGLRLELQELPDLLLELQGKRGSMHTMQQRSKQQVCDIRCPSPTFLLQPST